MLRFLFTFYVGLVLVSGSNRNIVMIRGVINTETDPGFRHQDHPSRHFRGLSISDRLSHPMPATFLVHVNETEADNVRDQVQDRHQMSLSSYLPHNTFVVLATHAQANDIETIPGVLWVGNLPSYHKISPTVSLPPPTTTGEFIPPPELLSEPVFNVSSPRPLNETQDPLSVRDVHGAPMNETAIPSLIVSISEATPPRSRQDLTAIISRLAEDIANDERTQIPYPVPIIIIRSDRLRIELQSEAQLQSVAEVVSDDPAVSFVERRMKPQLLNRWARGIIANGLDTVADYTKRLDLLSWQNNLYGQGQVIGLADSGLDYKHCFFADSTYGVPFKAFKSNPTANDVLPSDSLHRKITQYVVYGDGSDDAEGHGTHVAGTIAGQAPTGINTYSSYEGMSTQSKIAFFDMGTSDGSLSLPDDLTTPFLHWAYLAGARLHSNSWGVSSPYYTTNSRDMDQYMYDHKDFLVVVAAGNDGSCNGQSTVGSPATAKNIIAVGATMTNLDNYQSTGVQPPYYSSGQSSYFTSNNIAFFSSRGPTSDLRIKPDIVAPGYNTISSKVGSQCGQPVSSVFSSKSGTSMATPAVTGNLALIRQYLIEGFYPSGARNQVDGFVPSASLIKAIAIAGGTRLTGSRLVSDTYVSSSPKCPNPKFVSISQYPGLDQGWGRLELDTVLKTKSAPTSSAFLLLGMDRRLTSTFGDITISSRQTHTYRLCAIKSTAPAPKIVLVWTDPAAQPMSGVQLVNNLDLEVYYQQTGNTHLGNAGVYQGTGPDVRNPVETVVLDSPTSNMDVTVVVRARTINVGNGQPYSLVVTGSIRAGACKTLTSVNVTDLNLAAEVTGPTVGDKSVPASNSSTESSSPGFTDIAIKVSAVLAAALVVVLVVCIVVQRRQQRKRLQKDRENLQIPPLNLGLAGVQKIVGASPQSEKSAQTVPWGAKSKNTA